MANRGKVHQYFQVPLDKEKEVNYLLEPVIAGHSSNKGSTESTYVVSFVKSVNPVLQKGPMCGLVALTMAYELLHATKIDHTDDSHQQNSHPEHILDFAQTRDYTKQGEMFSVQYMRCIGEQHLSLNVETPLTESLTSELLVKHLLSPNKVVLVPYDADKNHSPCLANGHKAHWCVLVGCVLRMETNGATTELLKLCTPSQGYLSLREDSKETFLCTLSSGKWQVTDIHVFARHGKSRHMGLWDWDELRGSNENLVEADPQRTKAGEYIIPEPGGIRDGLCSQVVVLSIDK